MYLFLNLKLLRKDTVKILIWFSKRMQYSTQQRLLIMIEKWRHSLDKGGHYEALLTKLS